MEHLIDFVCVMDFQSMKNSFEYHNHQKYDVCAWAEDDLLCIDLFWMPGDSALKGHSRFGVLEVDATKLDQASTLYSRFSRNFSAKKKEYFLSI